MGGLIGGLLSVPMGWSFPQGLDKTIILAMVGAVVGYATQELLKYGVKQWKKYRENRRNNEKQKTK